MREEFGLPAERVSIRRFLQKEDGNMIVLGLFFFTLMVMMGGMAVDLMRYEARRTELQQTTDRAVLAAASMRQTLDPTAVVNDYFKKAGLSDKLRNVKVTQSFNAKEVSVIANSEVTPFFMQMTGVKSLTAPGNGTAIEKITDVEISLVLDISGSMDGSRLTNLKSAAAEFVDTIFKNDTEGRTTMSLVPYNGQVNLPVKMRQRFNVTNLTGIADANCLDLPPSTYGSTTISTTTAVPQTGYMDPGTTTTTSDNKYYSPPSLASAWIWCNVNTTNRVVPMSNSPTALKNAINGISALGATSIDLGMKWGVTLLDPGTRTLTAGLITDGLVQSKFSDRPFDYNTKEKLKVVVLMTDGENYDEYRLKDGYRTELSPIWFSTGDSLFSIYHASQSGSNKYWVPKTGTWQASAYNSGKGAVNLKWNEVWAKVPMQWVAYQLYARPLGGSNASTRTTLFNTWMGNFREIVDSPDMDTRLQQICSLAKGQNIVVYGIAFEAPANGQKQIHDCATSDGHYFNASVLQIQTVFRAIASSISSLRLTQ